MKKIHRNAAGIDIGAKQIFIGTEGREVVSFDTFTEDLEKAAAYLKENGIKTVAMEATGNYWFILYDILEAHGFDVWLVDGRHTKQVPGKKTDVKDCQWIQQLHSHGLLSRCFVADHQIQELRTYQRMREDYIRTQAMYVNHMQKAMISMNLRVKEVLSQLHGASGLRIIRAILAGERDPEKLAGLAQTIVLKNKKQDLIKSLKGHYSEAGIFALEEALASYVHCEERIKNCDRHLERVLKKMSGGAEPKEKTGKRKTVRHHKPGIDNLGGHLLKIFDHKDPTALPGITDYNWMQLLAEVGTDLKKWPTPKHFTSWLKLSPGQHSSGKMRKNLKSKGQPKAGLIFKQAATSLLNSKNPFLGAFARRLRARKGPGPAIKATARKLAVLYWKLCVNGLEYVERGIKDYQDKIIMNEERNIMKKARKLGLVISYTSTT